MIDPKRFGRTSGGKVSPIMFNIRLRRRGAKPTADDVLAALEYILDTGVVPDGWQLAYINWQHGTPPASDNWRTGRLHDFQALHAPIHAALHSARIAIVRTPRRGDG